MGFIIVEVCESNPLSSLHLDFLEKRYLGVSVLHSECMSHCGLCEHNIYAYVNGQIVFANDTQTCIERICQRIEHVIAELNEV